MIFMEEPSPLLPFSSSKEIILDISNFPAGFYVILIRNHKEIIGYGKFIVK
jgi:hypothetical protein